MAAIFMQILYKNYSVNVIDISEFLRAEKNESIFDTY